jgi:hypothetical protein
MPIPEVTAKDEIEITLTECPKKLLKHAIKYWYIHDSKGLLTFNCDEKEKTEVIEKLISRIWNSVKMFSLSIDNAREFVIRIKLAGLSLQDRNKKL